MELGADMKNRANMKKEGKYKKRRRI